MSARDEAKARVRAKIEAERSLPASERLMNLLHATYTEADARALLDAHVAERAPEQAAEIDRLRAELAKRPDEEYPGELAHLRDLLRAVGRAADGRPKVTELLIDHYSDSRIVDAELAKNAASSNSTAGGNRPELCRCGHGRAYHDAKFNDPQCRLCPEDGEKTWRHPFTTEGGDR